LADAGRGERLVLPLGEDLVRRRAELLRHHLNRRFGRERRSFVQELLELGLEALLVAGRREAVDVARHLAGLERQTPHFAERLQHRLGGLLHLDAHLGVRRGGFLFGALAAEEALRTFDRERDRARSEASELREAAETTGRRFVFRLFPGHSTSKS